MQRRTSTASKTGKNKCSSIVATPPIEHPKPSQPQGSRIARSGSKAGHSRQATLTANIKKYQFLPINNISILKSMLRNSVEQMASEREPASQDKIASSALYKKLQLELQCMKKNYIKEITALKDEIKELDDLIVAQKETLLSLIHKRSKMEADVSKYNDQLIELQQSNYDRYWDVAARINEAEDYEELLELEDEMGSVSRGLPQPELEKFIQARETRKGKGPNPEETEGCCICCQQISEDELICSLPCGHSHHSCCIREWLGINKVCPLCRKEVPG